MAGVAVYPKHTWAAMQARDAVTVEWGLSAAKVRDSTTIKEEIEAALDAPEEFNVLKNDPAPMHKAVETIDETFYFPLLAHAPMAPLNYTIEANEDGGVTLHDGCQFPNGPHMAMAQIFQLPMEKVRINFMLAGGSFGRCATPDKTIRSRHRLRSRSWIDRAPVKLVRSQEDDMRYGFYRPAFGHKVKVGLDGDGNVVAWHHRIAGQSIMKGTAFDSFSVHDWVEFA